MSENNMQVACHFAIPKPPEPDRDAAVQDGMRIVNRVGGVVNFLYPEKRSNALSSRFFCGLHQLRKLRAVDQRVDVHHVFSNGLYPYPVLAFLKKPIVFSSLIGLSSQKRLLYPLFLRNVRHFTVPSGSDQSLLKNWGYENISVVTSGIDLSRFFTSPLVLEKKFILFCGSAPWNSEQFRSKGVDLLLEAMRKLPWLHVVFLWRGLLLQEMRAKISAAGVRNQATVLSEYVDVNKVLAQVHAGIILVGNQNVIKGYPHSLLETLAAGKPIIVSDCLPIAELARQGAGEVVGGLSLLNFILAVKRIRKEYPKYVARITKLDLSCFSEEEMLQKMIGIYESI